MRLKSNHTECLHCRTTDHCIRARGICTRCYSDTSVRRKYRRLSAFHGTGPNAMLSGRDRPMPEPTDAIRGSREKIAVLQHRAMSGLELFHPLDGRSFLGA